MKEKIESLSFSLHIYEVIINDLKKEKKNQEIQKMQKNNQINIKLFNVQFIEKKGKKNLF